MIYAAIVFLPLLGALIAGFFGRLIGDRPSEIVTTSLLMVSAVLSWVVFVRVGFGHETAHIAIAPWITSGELDTSWSLRVDTLTSVMLVVVTTVSALVHLYSIGYMHEDDSRPRFFAYLSLFTFAMLMLVTSDNLLQMFFGWEGVGLASYLADRLLVQEAFGQRRRHQGVRRQPRRRLRLRARHLRPVRGDELHQPGRRFRRRSGSSRQVDRFPRLSGRYADAAGAAAVHGRHGQVGAVPAAHVAAGRHGRPDAGIGAHPRRDHGDGRRVHGGAPVARFRAGSRSAEGRRLHRRHYGFLRGHRRPRAERHQARHRLFDVLAARLHVRRLRRRRLWRRHLPPVHARGVQGAVVPRRRLGDPRHASRAGHAPHGRAREEAAVHLGS